VVKKGYSLRGNRVEGVVASILGDTRLAAMRIEGDLRPQ
jgi:hypothetical protein